jgi:RNA polymerase sigma-70 factor (ECF subfamily)
MGESQADITLLLRAAASGDRRDLDALMVAIYEDMRRLAMSHLRSERADHTLQPTALVHEAYVKLLGQRSTDWNDRLHFFAIASQIIRRILIDHAREREALKRGGGNARVSIHEQDIPTPTQDLDLLALDQALKELAELDERQARIVELRFFGGCSLEETADLLGVARRTVDRDWQAARAWLFVRLRDSVGAPGDA